MIFLKIKKDKIKLLIFYIFISLLIAYPFIFLTGIISRNIAFENHAKFNFSLHLLCVLNLFIVSYAVTIFLKKEFFLKKYFLDLTKVFFIFLASSIISSKIVSLLYRIIPSEIYFSNATQIIGLLLQIIIYYIAICFIFYFLDNKNNMRSEVR